ncbi:MAG: glycosyltransferase family 4 protein [Chloroflexi bacterium]|nr:glycosyltransferase family 4 protein [Chloroflexota bacterium]
MKIGLDITCTSGNRTGVGTYAANLVKSLLLGFPQDDFTLYAYSRFVDIHGLSDLTALRTDASLHVMRRSQTISAIRWNTLKLDPIEYQIGDVDLVHGLFHLVPKTRQAKKIVTIYDLTPFLFPETGRLISNLYHRYLIRSSVNLADAIITISATVKNELNRILNVPKEKIHVAYPGVDEPSWEDSKHGNEFLPSHGIHKPYVIFVGTIQPRKGIKTLLEAYSILRKNMSQSVQMVIVGSIGWKSKSIQETILRLQNTEELVHLSGKDTHTVRQLIRHAKILVMSSLYEGFGIPIIEAMNSGCPVIASDIPVFREIVQGAAILFPVENPTTLAETICSLLNDSQSVDRLRTRGYAVAKKYSWECCAHQVHSVYERVLS